MKEVFTAFLFLSRPGSFRRKGGSKRMRSDTLTYSPSHVQAGEQAVNFAASRPVSFLPRPILTGLILSLTLHVLFIGSVLVLGSRQGQRMDASIVVYLTAEEPGQAGGGAKGRAGQRPAREVLAGARHSAQTPSQAARKEKVEGRQDTALLSPAQRADAVSLTKEPASSPEPGHEGALSTIPSGTSTGGGIVYGGGGGSGASAGRGLRGGPGQGQGEAGSGAGQYVAAHFAYIRDRILKNLSYPRIAERMGWKGRVTVSFIIREDGTAESIRVVESSGYDILDADAIKTIKTSQPFPKPPAKAELIIPITYRLG